MVKARGFGLVELMIGFLMISLAITPIYFLFSSSRKMQAKAKEITLAMAAANSWISIVTDLEPATLVEMNSARTDELTGPLSLQNLQLEACPEGYERLATIIRTAEGGSGEPVVLIKVEVRWDEGGGTARSLVLATSRKGS